MQGDVHTEKEGDEDGAKRWGEEENTCGIGEDKVWVVLPHLGQAQQKVLSGVK